MVFLSVVSIGSVGRRVGFALAILWITTVGAAAVAQASDEPIGISPAADVVAKAPMAVSVTFDVPLSAAGASLRIITENGDDVGKGLVTTANQTLRRDLWLGAPAGDYSIQWTATSASGVQMSGSFSFTAARSNGQPESSSPGGRMSEAGRPGSVAGGPSYPAVPPGQTAPRPTLPTGRMSPPQPSAEPTSVSLAQPDFTFPAAAPGQVDAAGQSGGDQGMSRGFTVVPLIVGALLVLVAALIARFNRPRLHA